MLPLTTMTAVDTALVVRLLVKGHVVVYTVSWPLTVAVVAYSATAEVVLEHFWLEHDVIVITLVNN